MVTLRPALVGTAMTAGLALTSPAPAQFLGHTPVASQATQQQPTAHQAHRPPRLSHTAKRRTVRRAQRNAIGRRSAPGAAEAVHAGSAIQVAQRAKARTAHEGAKGGVERHASVEASVATRPRMRRYKRWTKRSRAAARQVRAHVAPLPRMRPAATEQADVLAPKVVQVFPVSTRGSSVTSRTFEFSSYEPIFAAAKPVLDFVSKANAELIVPHDEINEIDLAADAAAQAESARAQASAQATFAAPAEPGDTSWLRVLLLGVGGALTLGSVIRLLI